MRLEIKNLHVSINGKQILKGVNLTVNKGELHTIMGPNGSGKSTLSNALMGNPNYNIDKGTILLDGTDITKLRPDERAKKGLFLGFQYPVEVEGVAFGSFLFASCRSRKKITPQEFQKLLNEKLAILGLDKSFINRELNKGFSGGEKKRAEILQMLLLNPEITILDETDSGLDIDSLKRVSKAINLIKDDMGILLITHYQRILNYLKPTYIHVMLDGKIIRSGNPEFAKELEQKGYKWLVD